MATKSKKRKVKRKVSVSTKAKVVKKDSVRNDTLKKAPFIMNDNGLNMRIKIKRKSK